MFISFGKVFTLTSKVKHECLSNGKILYYYYYYYYYYYNYYYYYYYYEH